MFPPVAQQDSAADSDSEGRGFESSQAGQRAPLLRLKEKRIENKYEIIKHAIGAVCIIFYSIFFFLYSFEVKV